MVDTIRPRLFMWDDGGAPDLTGTPGAMAALLHACLVTGFNVTPVATATFAGGIVTLELTVGHGFRKGQWIEVAGAGQVEYNGIFEITEKLADSIKFEIAGIPTTPATGTIEVKVAPAGWERPFDSGDGLRMAFKQVPIDSTQHYLYIDDTEAVSARQSKLTGYKTMLDIDTGEEPFPYTGSTEQWIYWYKSTDTSSIRRWSLVADDRFFWINFNPNGDVEDGLDWRLYCFGDIKTLVPNDQWYCVINGSYRTASEEKYTGQIVTKAARDYDVSATLRFETGGAFARSFNGIDIGVPIMGALFPSTGPQYQYYGNGGTQDLGPPGSDGIMHPSPVDGGTVMFPMYSLEGYRYRSLVRGILPGCYGVFHPQPFQSLEIRHMSGQLSGRSFINNRVGSSNRHFSNWRREGQVLIDIKDKWR